jgi:hypothetical protein
MKKEEESYPLFLKMGIFSAEFFDSALQPSIFSDGHGQL